MNFKKAIFVIIAVIFSVMSLFAANPGDVVINEIAWMGTASSTSDEWLELYNTTDAPVDVSNWTVEGVGFVTEKLTGSIPAYGYYLIENDENCITDVAGDFVDATLSISNTATVTLKDASAVIIDEVDCSGGWFAGTSSGYYTMERIDPCSEGSISGNWGTNDGITINGIDADSTPINGTPKSDNSNMNSTCGATGPDTEQPTIAITDPVNGSTGFPIAQDIVITFSEEMDTATTAAFSIAPSPGGEGFTWNDTNVLAITHNSLSYNTTYTVTIDGDLAIDLAGNTLADSVAVDYTAGNSYAFTFQTGQYGDGTGTAAALPSNVLKNNYQTISINYTTAFDMAGGQVSVFIPANWSEPQYLAPTGDGYVELGFSTGSGSINTITGNETSGWTIIADITALDTGTDLIFYYGSQTGGGQGVQCSQTGSYEFTVASKGSGSLTVISSSPNVTVYEQSLSVVINEIAWMGTDASYSDEWMELYNPSNEDIDVTGWKIEGIGFTDETLEGIIPAGGFYLIENDEECVSDITGDFVDSSIAFADSGNDVVLKNSSGTVVDQVLCSGGWHAGLSSPDTSMERKDPCGDSNDAANWANNNGSTTNGLDANSAALIATPKAQNSVFTSSCDVYSPPTVEVTTPATAVNVDTSSLIIITFSEAMDEASVESALDITPSFAYTSAWSGGSSILTLTPSSPLLEDTLYTVFIGGFAMDTGGNALDGNGDGLPGDSYSFSFNTVDNMAPGTISDLAAFSYAELGGIRITFTAVGENSAATKTCDGYEIAYSTVPITNDTEFNAADKYDTSGITPLSPGASEEIILTLLPAGTTYYLSVKAYDEAGNYSDYGNSDSAVSGSYGISSAPNVPLATGGNGDLTITYSVGYPKLDGDDDLYVIIPSSFTQPTLSNITVTLDSSDTAAYTVSGSTVTISDISASSTVEIALNSYDFPEEKGQYGFELMVMENGSIPVDLSPATYDLLVPAVMTFDPSDDPHTAPGKDQPVSVLISSDTGLTLYGALVNGSIIDAPGTADLDIAVNYTDSTGAADFILSLAPEAGQHIVEFTCESLLEYFIDTSYEGNSIYTPYPNPATADVDIITFEINILEESNVKLTILTLDARKVVDIEDKVLSAGFHEIQWDLEDRFGHKVPGGIYFGLLKTDTFTKMVKFSVVR